MQNWSHIFSNETTVIDACLHGVLLPKDTQKGFWHSSKKVRGLRVHRDISLFSKTMLDYRLVEVCTTCSVQCTVLWQYDLSILDWAFLCGSFLDLSFAFFRFLITHHSRSRLHLFVLSPILLLSVARHQQTYTATTLTMTSKRQGMKASVFIATTVGKP